MATPNSKNPLVALIAQLRDQLKTVAKRANDKLKTLPPLEAFEKTAPAYSAVLNCGYALDFLEQTANDMLRDLDAVDPEAAMTEGAEDVLKLRIESGDLVPKAVLEKRIADGELLTKELAQAAADTAASNREKAVRDQLALVETRRKELSTPKSATEPALLTAELAGRLSSELLAADDYATRAAVVAQRVKDSNALGLELPDLLNSAAEIAVDEAGNKVFAERLSIVKSIAEKANGGPIKEPFALGGGAGGGGTAGELEAVF